MKNWEQKRNEEQSQFLREQRHFDKYKSCYIALTLLSILAISAALLIRLLRSLAMPDKYQQYVAKPASAFIGLIGLYWGFKRLLSVG